MTRLISTNCVHGMKRVLEVLFGATKTNSSDYKTGYAAFKNGDYETAFRIWELIWRDK